MRKIELIEKILQTEIDYVQLLKDFNETKLEISEIFPMDYTDAIQIFIGDMFGEAYIENVNTYDEVDAGVLASHILERDPTLEEEATKEEIVDLLCLLYQMESLVSKTYICFSNLGVDFNIIDQNNFNFKLIEEILGDNDEAHYLREEHLYNGLSLQHLRKLISLQVQNSSCWKA